MSNTPTSSNTASTDEKEMSFVEHLDELRIHLIRIAIGIVAAAIFVFFATDFILKEIVFGPLQDNFLTYKAICYVSHLLQQGDALCYTPAKINLVTFEMGEAFLLHMKICFFGGLIIAFPYILWELWKFIKPALHDNERQSTYGVVFACSTLFMMGILFGYFVLAPFSISFLVGYSLPMINADTGGNLVKATSLINYMLMFTIPIGLVFEMPIIVYYLSKIGLVTDAFMKEYRRHAIVFILVVAAIVTPPDVMTQIVVSIPLYILYEVSISIAAKQTRIRAEADRD